MKSVLAYPGTMAHAQQIAQALDERGALEVYVTAAHFEPSGRAVSMLARMLPASARHSLARQLGRRRVGSVAGHLVRSYPAWELLRTAVEKGGGGRVLTDIVWDIASHRFDDLVARHHVPGAQAVHAFEYVALKSFEVARQRGVARILHLPALDNGQFNAVRQRELSAWPELAAPGDRHFERHFARRQERRLREMALADVVVCNSRITAESHIAAGADRDHILTVPLGAPSPIGEVKVDASRERRALRVVYAGAFKLLKGAHYLLEAWRRLDAGRNARLDVYGSMQLPRRLLARQCEGIEFHGPVPQSLLFEAFEQADVLVFPTLSDGFGMVVSEAMSRGLPVITTDMAGASDLVTPDNGLIVPSADAAALAEALQWCLDNRQRLKEMRHHALATARRRQWSDFRRELIAGLDAALRRRGYEPSFGPLDSVGVAADGR